MLNVHRSLFVTQLIPAPLEIPTTSKPWAENTAVVMQLQCQPALIFGADVTFTSPSRRGSSR